LQRKTTNTKNKNKAFEKIRTRREKGTEKKGRSRRRITFSHYKETADYVSNASETIGQHLRGVRGRVAAIPLTGKGEKRLHEKKERKKYRDDQGRMMQPRRSFFEPKSQANRCKWTRGRKERKKHKSRIRKVAMATKK